MMNLVIVMCMNCMMAEVYFNWDKILYKNKLHVYKINQNTNYTVHFRQKLKIII